MNKLGFGDKVVVISAGLGWALAVTLFPLAVFKSANFINLTSQGFRGETSALREWMIIALLSAVVLMLAAIGLIIVYALKVKAESPP